MGLLVRSTIPFYVTDIWDHLHFTAMWWARSLEIVKDPELFEYDVIVEKDGEFFELVWHR